MGKIICEVCGTVYPDSADCCPICGYSRDRGGFDQSEDLLNDQQDAYAYDPAVDGETDGFDFADYDLDGSNAGNDSEDLQFEEPRKAIFDYDAVNPGSNEEYDSYADVSGQETLNDYPQDYYDNYDNYDQKEPKSHMGLIVFLVILILLLIGASAFLMVKYVLPSVLGPQMPEVPQTEMVTEALTEAPNTEPVIPCQSLALVEGGEVSLSREGQFYLIHAAVIPEDTTDQLTYQSEDENVILVDATGKITAVGEGSTNVILTCGSQIIKLPVTVSYQEETEATVEETEAAEDGNEEAGAPEGTEDGEAEATEEKKDDGLKDVVLKLKKTDLMSGVPGVSFRLELDCDLTPEEVTWSTTHAGVATVKNGVVTTVGGGICKIIAKYGDQEVSCLIRCNF